MNWAGSAADLCTPPHKHELVPVVSAGELLAGLCITCGEQTEPEEWIAQGDRIMAEHQQHTQAAEHAVIRAARIAACGERHQPEPVAEVVAWANNTPVRTLYGPCQECGQ